ncbi:MAG: type IX secretion system membrane protein PorP/SprF [Sphingobacteriaceae bacterium]|nr:type IX secretion system membrane protein PorP/SprF [Sphingobacteriaceae bacterium]
MKENPILLTGGYFIGMDRDHGIKPSLLVRYVNNSPVTADINLNYYYKYQFGLGVSYRTNKSLVGIAEFGISHQLRVCYSYDCELNRLKKYQSGSHEILIRYYFGYNINAKNPRTMFIANYWPTNYFSMSRVHFLITVTKFHRRFGTNKNISTFKDQHK